MNCSRVQQALCLPDRGLIGRWNAHRIARHLEHCKACAEFAAGLSSLEEQTRRWREEDPPAMLQTRIAAALPQEREAFAAGVGWQPWERGRAVRPFAFALTVALILTGLLLLSFHSDTAKAALRKMQEAVAAVRNAHTRIFTLQQNGVMHLEEEEWYEAGKWRKEGDYGTRIILGDTYWRYYPEQKRLISMKELGRQRSHFSLEALTHDMASPDAQFTIQTQALTQEAGKPVSRLLVERAGVSHPEQYARFLYWVDETTHLPIRMEEQHQIQEIQGDWKTTRRMEFEFNLNLPATLFDPRHLIGNGR